MARSKALVSIHGSARRTVSGASSPPWKTNWNSGPTSHENSPVASDNATIAATATPKRPRCGVSVESSRRYGCIAAQGTRKRLGGGSKLT